MASFGEEGRRLSYGSYLRVPELLGLQSRLTDAHDELLFIVVHQVHELWFAQILWELEAARDAMSSGASSGASSVAALRALRRVHVIERVLVSQVEVLETMAPSDFLEFRNQLAPASGFQSVQFREIEVLSGLREPSLLARVECSDVERSRLDRRLSEPSLWDGFLTLVGDRPLADVVAGRAGPELFDLSEALLDHDEAFALWRARHVLMVERQIGSKPGTGGSTGAPYLRGTLDKRFFPELWELRSSL